MTGTGVLPTITRAEAERGRFFDNSREYSQSVFRSRANRVLCDGPLSTGKTRVLLEKMRECCLKYPGCRWLLARSFRKWLTNSALVTWEEKVVEAGVLQPDKIHRSNRSEYRFKNGSIVVVAGLDDPQGVFSAEYDGAIIIEGIEVSQDTIEKVDGRLRFGKMPYQQLLMDCNPAHPTHHVKQMADAGWFHRLPMRHRDNPSLFLADGTMTRRGAEYMARLDGLQGVRRRRLRDGEWCQSDGVVWEGFDTAVHVIASFPIPSHWPRYWVIDFGHTNPSVLQWWAEDDDGRLYLYREIYMTKTRVSVLAELALKQVGAWNETTGRIAWESATEPRPTIVIADHDAGDRATFEHVTQLATQPAEKAVNAGIQDAADRFAMAEDGRPRMFVFADALCHEPDANLTEQHKPFRTSDELPAYVWDPAAKKGERPLKVDDRGCDALRYIARHLANGQTGPVEYGADYASLQPENRW